MNAHDILNNPFLNKDRIYSETDQTELLAYCLPYVQTIERM